ncbi:dcp2-domain-containing protein [Ceraceosorus bombacis]|uniref:Dcp2-domain-containing protein n=1 Tax=Ceraceosorus bombacis TaxID=401625 RepID=A0A0P1BQY4_9BASI|nr:dcp2-domain-containing protein [Ceraceosorus bombacis]
MGVIRGPSLAPLAGSSATASTSKSAATSSAASTAQSTTNDAAYAYASLTFQEVLEDLSSRFIVNLPAEELSSIERICFQVEQAHWFYEDFLRPINPSLPSQGLRRFSGSLLQASAQTVPLIQQYTSGGALDAVFDDFMRYKTRVPVCGIVLLNTTWDKCLLVKGWKSSSAWGFPKGKINQSESERDCAVREMLEETGFNCDELLPSNSAEYMELTMREQRIRLYIVPGIEEDTRFETLTRKEISKIAWFKLSDLPTWKKHKEPAAGLGGKFYLISPFVGKLRAWIQDHKHATLGGDVWAKSDPLVESERVGTPTAPRAHRPPAGAPTGPRAQRNGKGNSPATMRDSMEEKAVMRLDPSLLFGDASQSATPASAIPPTGQVISSNGTGPRQDGGLLALLGVAPPQYDVSAGTSKQGSGPGCGVTGKGVDMINAAGDQRGRELLDLLRADSGASGHGTRTQPGAPAQELDEREQGTQALLAALNLGPSASAGQNAAAPALPSTTSPSSETVRRHRAEPSALLALLRGEVPPSRTDTGLGTPQPNALADKASGGNSTATPLPAPRAQNTAHAQSLLNMIAAKSSFSLPGPSGPSDARAEQPVSPYPDSVYPHLEHADPFGQAASSQEEAARAVKREALLARLVQPATSQVQSHSQPAGNHTALPSEMQSPSAPDLDLSSVDPALLAKALGLPWPLPPHLAGANPQEAHQGHIVQTPTKAASTQARNPVSPHVQEASNWLASLQAQAARQAPQNQTDQPSSNLHESMPTHQLHPQMLPPLPPPPHISQLQASLPMMEARAHGADFRSAPLQQPPQHLLSPHHGPAMPNATHVSLQRQPPLSTGGGAQAQGVGEFRFPAPGNLTEGPKSVEAPKALSPSAAPRQHSVSGGASDLLALLNGGSNASASTSHSPSAPLAPATATSHLPLHLSSPYRHPQPPPFAPQWYSVAPPPPPLSSHPQPPPAPWHHPPPPARGMLPPFGLSPGTQPPPVYAINSQPAPPGEPDFGPSFAGQPPRTHG